MRLPSLVYSVEKRTAVYFRQTGSRNEPKVQFRKFQRQNGIGRKRVHSKATGRCPEGSSKRNARVSKLGNTLLRTSVARRCRETPAFGSEGSETEGAFGVNDAPNPSQLHESKEEAYEAECLTPLRTLVESADRLHVSSGNRELRCSVGTGQDYLETGGQGSGYLQQLSERRRWTSRRNPYARCGPRSPSSNRP